MNKKENPFILNFQGIAKSENKPSKRIYFKKQFKFQLPKLPNSSLGQADGQKTIAQLIQNLQKINKDPKSELHPLLSECIRVLRGDRFLKKDLMIRKTQHTEAIEKENELNTNQLYEISKSQVINVEKSLIRKIESKDLFEKVSKANYMNKASQEVAENQLINTLKSKIKEKDNVIRKLHNRIDELVQNLNKQKALVLAQTHSNQSILNEKQNLFKENQTQLYEIKEMNQTIKNLNEQLELKVSMNSELLQKCSVFEDQIKERQKELISLWQVALLNSAQK